MQLCGAVIFFQAFSLAGFQPGGHTIQVHPVTYHEFRSVWNNTYQHPGCFWEEILERGTYNCSFCKPCSSFVSDINAQGLDEEQTWQDRILDFENRKRRKETKKVIFSLGWFRYTIFWLVTSNKDDLNDPIWLGTYFSKTGSTRRLLWNRVNSNYSISLLWVHEIICISQNIRYMYSIYIYICMCE